MKYQVIFDVKILHMISSFFVGIQNPTMVSAAHDKFKADDGCKTRNVLYILDILR